MALLNTPFTTEGCAWIIAGVFPIICMAFLPVLIFPWGAYMAWSFWNNFMNQQHVSSEKKAIYITGCDSGFGHDTALALDQAGFHVFAGCLNAQGEGANWLRAQSSDRLEILSLDVTKKESVTQCAEAIKQACSERNIQLWGLYSNAGVASAGEIEWCPIELYRKSMDVNFFGALSVIKSVLPLIRKSKGRISIITSGIARHPMPGRSTYCTAKAALESLASCLRFEMSKFGVKVSTIVPGNYTYATNVFDNMEDKIQNVYDGMDPQIRNDYGDLYIKVFKGSVARGYKASSEETSPDTSWVINDIVDSLTSVHPRDRYRSMPPSWIAFDVLMCRIPEEWKTWYFAWKNRNFPRPMSLFR